MSGGLERGLVETSVGFLRFAQNLLIRFSKSTPTGLVECLSPLGSRSSAANALMSWAFFRYEWLYLVGQRRYVLVIRSTAVNGGAPGSS